MYVYFRYTDTSKVMVVSNTGEKEKGLNLKRFAEQLKGATTALDVMTGQRISLDKLIIGPKKFFVLEITP